MNFIDSYKKLEKLCNEMYGDKHGVSLYIDEMINTPVGSRYVKSWNEDLKQLKHYRWVRNQIVHEPGCTETNMCNRDDIQWINIPFIIQNHSREMKGDRKSTRLNSSH